jgi:hypothetical protein
VDEDDVHDDDDDDDAFVPPSFLPNAPAGGTLTLASTSSSSSGSDEDRNGGDGGRSAVLHFDGMDSPDAAAASPPPPPMGCATIDDTAAGICMEKRRGRRTKKTKNRRRNTTLFVVPPPSDSVVDALGEDGDDEGEEDCPEETRDVCAVRRSSGSSSGAEGRSKDTTGRSAAGGRDAVDREDCHGRCRAYKDEHASLRFLIGILKLEKSDAEARLGQLSEAFEAKSAQSKTMAAELTNLRGEAAALRQAAADKQAQMDAMVSSLQTQMMQGLSAAVEKTKKLQVELETVTAEKERLREELEALRAESE